jgi:hypothetical protein
LGGGVGESAQVQDDSDAALYAEYGDDPELAYALKMSMMEEEAK